MIFPFVLFDAAIPPVLASPPPAPHVGNPQGRLAYQQNCETCHGVDLRGGPNAPNIRGVDPAYVDFMMQTGRMPAAVPWIEVGHRGPQLSQETIAAIDAYVSSVQPGGEPIPAVSAGGDADHGRELYRENCMHCHGANQEGAPVGFTQWAPKLDEAPVTQVAEAVRVGPREMPRFSHQQLSDRDLDDLVTYISETRADEHPQAPLKSGGPVPEGLFGWLVAGALAAVGFAFSKTSRKDAK